MYTMSSNIHSLVRVHITHIPHTRMRVKQKKYRMHSVKLIEKCKINEHCT